MNKSVNLVAKFLSMLLLLKRWKFQRSLRFWINTFEIQWIWLIITLTGPKLFYMEVALADIQKSPTALKIVIEIRGFSQMATPNLSSEVCLTREATKLLSCWVCIILEKCIPEEANVSLISYFLAKIRWQIQ